MRDGVPSPQCPTSEKSVGYKIRFHHEAKADLNKFEATYKPTPLPKRVKRWIDELAQEAESHRWQLSLDLVSFLGNTSQADELIRHWRLLWREMRTL